MVIPPAGICMEKAGKMNGYCWKQNVFSLPLEYAVIILLMIYESNR